MDYKADVKPRYICKNCRHFKANDDEGGLCRRFPPQVVAAERAAFPSVLNEWVCGEHNR